MEDSGKYLTVAEHTEFAKRIEEENDRQNHRLSEIESTIKEISRLTVSVEKMATNMENMVKEQERVSERLKVIEDKPTKRWETLIGGIITGVVGILIGLMSAGFIK